MKEFWQSLFDEKFVLGALSVTFALGAIYLIRTDSDKEYVTAFTGFVSMVLGALLRGITHQGNGGTK